MKFEYFGGEQRSPEWFKLRIGRITASRLGDWMAVSKAKGKEGQPLKARLDYETELMFERQFDVAYNNYISEAMQDGVNYEDFAVSQYEKITGNATEHCGAWYSDTFMASPDRMVGEDGLLEVKVVRDNTFTDILVNGIPPKWWYQIQGQLMASGRKWCDFAALNLGTQRMKIIRVLPDKEFHEYLELALDEKLVVAKFSEDQLFELPDKVSAPETPALLQDGDAPEGF